MLCLIVFMSVFSHKQSVIEGLGGLVGGRHLGAEEAGLAPDGRTHEAHI
jgi:hypothetical protein